jgi:hypothetical protein
MVAPLVALNKALSWAVALRIVLGMAYDSIESIGLTTFMKAQGGQITLESRWRLTEFALGSRRDHAEAHRGIALRSQYREAKKSLLADIYQVLGIGGLGNTKVGSAVKWKSCGYH